MKTNNIVMGVLVAVIAVMGVAFAAFSTTLNINGTATISSSWKVTKPLRKTKSMTIKVLKKIKHTLVKLW